MKTERITLLGSPQFKAFLGAEARKEGVSVSELVRRRCEGVASEDEQVLAELVGELRKATAEAADSLRAGMAAAQAALDEIAARRETQAGAAQDAARETGGEPYASVDIYKGGPVMFEHLRVSEVLPAGALDATGRTRRWKEVKVGHAVIGKTGAGKAVTVKVDYGTNPRAKGAAKEASSPSKQKGHRQKVPR